MNAPLFLSPEQIYALTHRRRSTAQAKALRMMGVQFKVRPDGTVAVATGHYEKLFGVAPGASSQEADFTFNWGKRGATSS